jgi:hypothetical protein
VHGWRRSLGPKRGLLAPLRPIHRVRNRAFFCALRNPPSPVHPNAPPQRSQAVFCCVLYTPTILRSLVRNGAVFVRALPPLRLTVSRPPAPLPLSSSPRSDGEGKDEGQVAWSCAPYAAAQVAWCRPPSPSAGPWRARSSVLQEPVLQEPHAPTRALDEFARASAPLIGGDALVQEIGVLRTELETCALSSGQSGTRCPSPAAASACPCSTR